MAEKADYIIKKTEKGPLQRFKNQNLLLKKFGELGLKIYRAITGKRTVNELKKDLALDDNIFYPVIEYMKETEMVEVVPTGEKEPLEKPPAAKPPKKPTRKEKPEEEVPKEMEEKPALPEEEIEAKEEEKEIEAEIEVPEKKEEEEEFFEEIKPIKPIEEEAEERRAEEKEAGEEAAEEERKEEEEEAAEEAEELEEKPEEEIFAEEKEFSFEEPEEENAVEKTIKKKYGDIGLQVYNLIDGQKTAEEIMKEVGISEPKLIEILDFLDKEGIIKLEYPGGKKEAEESKAVAREETKEEGFAPILETEKEGMPRETITIPNPVEVPFRLPIDVIKSVQINTNVLLKFKDDGKRVLMAIDGERDVVDIAIKLQISLYRVYEILNYLIENAVVMLKPITRDVVKKKYGEDAFTIYKKYGREGLMLYELIGKDLSFKDMIARTTTDKQKALDMFLFIHEVLGIELPLDKEILAKQIGL